MTKLDLKKKLEHLYAPAPNAVVRVEVPPMRYLMLDGAGDPNTSPAYAQAVEALFAVAYAIKFAVKRGAQKIDYGVMPLEGLWWADDMSEFSVERKAKWKWTMMIMQPEMITGDIVKTALRDVARKKALPALDGVRFERLDEGSCAQTLHVGPFSEEGPTIERVHQFIRAHGELTGRHHEIYLTDIRKAAPSKWKTVIRQPMKET
jgi:hypothetical protein